MGALKAYASRDNKYVEAKNKLVNNVGNFYKGREKIIEGSKNGVIPVYYGNCDRFNEDEDDDDEDEQEEQEEQEEQKLIRNDYKTLIKQITDEEKDINDEIFKKYFKVQRPSDMLVFLNNKKNDTEMKNQLVNLINSGLKDLKEKTKKMSKVEIDIEKPDEIVNIVEKIFKFNEQNQQGQGIKILTPQQMLNRLPIALVQLKAGNNSNKLKNEIRQLLYSLYRSKNITEQVYKILIGII